MVILETLPPKKSKSRINIHFDHCTPVVRECEKADANWDDRYACSESYAPLQFAWDHLLGKVEFTANLQLDYAPLCHTVSLACLDIFIISLSFLSCERLAVGSFLSAESAEKNSRLSRKWHRQAHTHTHIQAIFLFCFLRFSSIASQIQVGEENHHQHHHSTIITILPSTQH